MKSYTDIEQSHKLAETLPIDWERKEVMFDEERTQNTTYI